MIKTRLCLLYLGAAFFVAGLTWLAANGGEPSAQRNVRKWEYVLVEDSRILGVVVISAPGRDPVFGTKWEEACKNCGLPEGTNNRARFLNAMGDRGFEIIAVTIDPKGSTEYYLKRPAN